MKHWKALFCLTVAAWAFNSCELPSGGGGTEAEGISGQIVNPQGTPVYGASVHVYSSDSTGTTGVVKDSTLTDANGRFNFSKLTDGQYNVESSWKQNGSTQAVLISNVILHGGTNLGIDTLHTAGSIFVVAQSNGSPLAGAQCYVPGSSLISISDDSGNCLITGVPPGIFNIRISYQGLQTLTSADIQVQSGITADAGTFDLVADPALAPPTPTGVLAQYDSTSGIVTLTWNTVQVSDLAGYVVYRRNDLTQTPVKISVNLVTNTIFKDTLRRGNGDNNRMLYLYQVKAQDKDGNLSFLYSDPVGITAVPPIQQGQYFSLNSSTVALWTFNSHNNGVFKDLSANSFDFSNASNFGLTSSPYDSAVVFTGSSNYLTYAVTSALTVAPTGQMTYEARVYMSQYPSTSNASGVSTLIGTYDGMRLIIWSDGRLQASGQRLSGTTSYWWSANSAVGAVPLNRWVDLAIAFDQTTKQAYAYIDETPTQLYDGSITSDPFRIPTTPLSVGNSSVDNQPFNGKIDEIRISNNLILGAGLPLIAGSPP